MKFVVHPERPGNGSVPWRWRLETEAGVVIARSERKFDDTVECERELRAIISGAAKTKIIRISSEPPLSDKPVTAIGRIRSALKRV